VSVIDFPESPIVNDCLAAGRTLVKYDGEKWLIASYGIDAPGYGTIDGGSPLVSSSVIKVNGGAAGCDFSESIGINGGLA
jgi:hypothetical protein